MLAEFWRLEKEAEEMGEERIVSTDERDSHAYRWKNHHPFRNLLLEQARSARMRSPGMTSISASSKAQSCR